MRRKAKLGRYPGTSLAAARNRAAAIMEAVDRGEDPVGNERETITRRKTQTLTFNDLLQDYLQELRTNEVKSTLEIERSLIKDAVPSIGKLHSTSVTPVQIEAIIDAVKERGSESAARHLLSYLRSIFSYALRGSPSLREKYDLTSNPALDVGRGTRGRSGKYGRPNTKDRALTDAEIAIVWRAGDASEMADTTKRVIKSLILTGQRLGEVRGALVDEFELTQGRET